MCQFIETIRIVDSEIMNLSYHQRRMDDTLVHFGGKKIFLLPFLHLHNLPKKMREGIIKARVVYDKEGIKELIYAPYTLRSIHSLKLVTCNEVDYSYKSTNRRMLDKLKQKSLDADEIIIVKNNLLTDTTYSNIALYDGNKWYTPKTPLLKGTMRQLLIDQKILIEKDIKAKDVSLYQKISLINAMMPLGTCEVSLRDSLL